jgi:iron-sulfur cluster protein
MTEHNPGATLEQRISEAIENPQHRDSLYRCMERGRNNRAARLAELPGGLGFRHEVRAAKERCLDQQEELLARFVDNARKRGAHVYLAPTGRDAIDYVMRLAVERNAKLIAKSKSLTTEEIELNRPLEEAGLRVVETDLGELIIQLVHEKPYHLVFPSVHKTAKDVAEIFTKEIGRPVPNDIDEIMKVVRAYLRPIFLNAQIGLTGANVGIAETGGIVIETNEGNARLVSSIGDCHICVMGREKIVDTIDDAMLMVLAHPVSATGQCPTTYVTWMHGRAPLGEGAGRPRESHIVILDNGRTAMRDDPILREALHCIRCGACMNICPTYGVVGGHTFGHIYPGPIGIPWTAAVHGVDKAAHFAPLCISCGLCKEICPAEIDMPFMIAEIKQRGREHRPPTKAERTMMAADRFAALGSLLAPIANPLLSNGPFRALLEKITGLDRRRTMPKFNRRPYIRRHRARPAANAAAATRRVALFVDVYANYNAPELAEKAVHLLERAGCEVLVPEQKPSGYPYIAYGDLDAARKIAAYNAARFAPFAREGCTIVALEPTAIYTLTNSYPRLLPESHDAAEVARHSREFFDCLIEWETAPAARPLEGRRFGVHCSCHQRPLGSAKSAVAWLERRGAAVQRIETGTCCGMGGTFGMKEGLLGFDLAQAVGEPLFTAFKNSGVEAIVTESSVCRLHLQQGTGLRVIHPLELTA